MPVNDLGYRKWNGPISSPATRWLVIAMAGIKIVFKSQWIKRIMFLAWGPALVVGIGFFVYEQYVERRDDVLNTSTDESQNFPSNPNPSTEQDRPLPPQPDFGPDPPEGFQEDWERGGPNGTRPRRNRRGNQVPANIREIPPFIRGMLILLSSEEQANKAMMVFSKSPNEARGFVWSFILMNMLSRTQGIMVILLIGIIAPPLIARDIRSRAFLFYFSKPISRTDYLLGKFATVGFYVGSVTLLPAIALYFVGVLLSPSLDVIYSTWHLPIRIIAACLISIVPSCLLALTLSSVTSESRFAGFAWFMIWILGLIAYRIVYAVNQYTAGMDIDNLSDFHTFWRVVSLYDCLTFLQAWIMGLETNHGYALTMLTFVIGLSVFCVYTIMKRISAPISA